MTGEGRGGSVNGVNVRRTLLRAMPSDPLPATEAVISLAPFVVRRRVAFGDCDPAGIVYTPRYGDYIAGAFFLFLDTRFAPSFVARLGALGVVPPARRVEMDLLRPLTPGDFLDLTVTVAEIGRSSYTLVALGATPEGHAVLEAKTTMVTVSMETRRPVSVPDAFRAALS